MPEDGEQHDALSADELLRQLSVPDAVLGTLATIVRLGHLKLEQGEGEQTRLAIETLRAVQPVLEGSVPPEALRELRQATANLQLAYADSVRSTTREEES